MPVRTASEFLGIVESSQLLSSQQLAELSQAEPADANRAAALLQERGWVTDWQAEQLLAGMSRLVLGRYKLLSLVGRGAMGAVYKAEHVNMHRTVALKVMAREILRDPKAVARFQREIRSAAALNHPNIVAALDADCVHDTYFLVMEFVDGEDLKSWVRRNGRAPIEWACECVRQAALGLQHAFERGMVHRDIKPGNLLLTASASGAPIVKILDLGLSRFASESGGGDDGGLTKTGQVMGTPDYIAPEQARDARSADIRADIFSLGCTLFELLAGRLPFTGRNVMEKLMSRALNDAPRLSTLRPEVPPDLEAIVARSLERDPSRRFQTPGDLAAALAPFSLSSDVPKVTAISPGTRESAAMTGTVDTRSDGTLGEIFAQLDEPVGRGAGNPAGGIRRGARRVTDTRKRLMVGATLAATLAGAVALWPPRGKDSTEQKKPSTAAVKTAPVSTERSEVPSSGPINLLKRIDVKRGYVNGLWRVENGLLISADEVGSRLSLGHVPPPEYDLKIVARRVKGKDAFVVGMVGPHGPFIVALDGWGGSTSGLQLLDNRSANSNDTTWKEPVFVDDKPTTLVCSLRTTGVKVTANGTTIIEFNDDLRRLQTDKYWSIPCNNCLFLGDWLTSFEISELTLIPQPAIKPDGQTAASRVAE